MRTARRSTSAEPRSSRRPSSSTCRQRGETSRRWLAGSIGLSTATVWEAVVLVRSGLDSIFIVNTVAGPEKLATIAALARDAEVMVAVDDAENAAEIAKAARAAGSTVGVLIEVDTGMDRAGVDTTEQAVELGGRLMELK